jgi:ABC-type phosphate/phosphonate transport system substrate-binding protein
VSVASLGMYDAPWLRAANDALWAAIRGHLPFAAPERLERGRGPYEIWRDPALLLGQTCGYPLMTALRGVVRVVATPVYDLPGCDGAWHRALVVARADDPAGGLADLRGRRAAINGRDSNSGMNLLRASVAPLAGGGRFFSEVVVTGAHLNSLAAVRDGGADVAAIDCVTHGLAARYRPDLLAGTRVLAATMAVPALPFVTAAATPEPVVAALRDALAAALPWPALGLRGVERLDAAAYEAVMALERGAASRGYPRLA